MFASLATLCSYQSALAETHCQTIDNILYSMSLVRDIQSAKNDLSYAESTSKLEKLVGKIALSDLISPNAEGAFPAETRAIFQYISSLQEAVAGAPPRYDDHTLQTIGHETSPEFTRSLQSLAAYWNCTAEELSPQLEAERRAVYSGRSIKHVTKAATELANPVLGQSKGRIRTSNSGIALQQVRLDSAIPKGGLQLFFLMAILALLIAAYSLRKRSKTFRMREKRRLLHMPVNIRIGALNYTMTMVDISMNGFKIQHPGVIQRPGKLRVELGGTWYRAQIKWNNTLFAGVRFKNPINTQTFNAVVQSSLQTKVKENR